MEWFRFYTRTLDSAKVQGLSLELFKAWVNLCCLARVHDGPLPPFKDIGFRLRVTERKAVDIVSSLEAANLIDRKPDGTFWMHDWSEHQRVSDNVAQRVARHREKRKSNVTVTPPDSDSEQSRLRADSDSEKNGQQRPFPSASEYPKTAAAIRERDPACDDLFIRRLAAVTIQTSLSDDSIPAGEVDKITDEVIADAVRESFSTYNGGKTHGSGLLLSRVPQIVRTWCKEPG